MRSWRVKVPGGLAGDEQVVVRDVLIGWNFSESHARVVLEMSKSIADRCHLIDS